MTEVAPPHASFAGKLTELELAIIAALGKAPFNIWDITGVQQLDKFQPITTEECLTVLYDLGRRGFVTGYGKNNAVWQATKLGRQAVLAAAAP